MTVFFVFLTHLNTDALYFRLSMLFQNYNKRIWVLENGNVFIKTTFLNILFESNNCSLLLGA